VNHKFGFGAVDTDRAVAYATTMTLLNSMSTYDTSTITVNAAIPDNTATGVANTLTIAGSGITKIEFAEVTFSSSNHTSAGDLKIQLISPSNTTSDLAEPHDCTNSSGTITTCSAYSGWVFGSARMLDEPVDGTWKLRVIDSVPADTGTFQSWRLKIYGRN
jgi:subtilisin-like proprotein convertase family protein